MLFYFPICSLTIWKLFCIHLIQKISVMGVEIGTSLLINSSWMRTYALTIFSSEVHVILIYQCRVLSAIKTHSIKLVTNWWEASHQSFILRNYIINCLVYWYLLFHVINHGMVFLFLGNALKSFLSVCVSLKRYQSICNLS